MSKSDLSSAINHYKKAVENDSDNGDRYFNLGYAYAADNQPVKALEMFAKADEVGSSPNVVGQLYKIMGMLCFDMRKYDDAVLNFIKSEKVIGIDMDLLNSATWTLYFRTPTISEFGYESDLEFCCELAEKVGVGAVPGSSFFRENVNHLIRLHFAKKDETLYEALNRLESIRRKMNK